MSLQFADLIRGRTRLKMSKEKVFNSIDKKQINVKIQKWPEKSWCGSYSKGIIKKTLISNWGKRRGKKSLVLLKDGWCT